jgi:hypothetical protein
MYPVLFALWHVDAPPSSVLHVQVTWLCVRVNVALPTAAEPALVPPSATATTRVTNAARWRVKAIRLVVAVVARKVTPTFFAHRIAKPGARANRLQLALLLPLTPFAGRDPLPARQDDERQLPVPDVKNVDATALLGASLSILFRSRWLNWSIR